MFKKKLKFLTIPTFVRLYLIIYKGNIFNEIKNLNRLEIM